MTRVIAAGVITVFIATTAAFGRGQTAPAAAKPMDYDTYCKLPDADAKRQAFFAMTAAGRGQMVRTHLERWRNANRARLTADQLSLLDDTIAAITDVTYADGPEGEASREKARQLTAKHAQLFSQADVLAMQPNAPCVSKSLSE